jgi:hypothetical protein
MRTVIVSAPATETLSLFGGGPEGRKDAAFLRKTGPFTAKEGMAANRSDILSPSHAEALGGPIGS